MMPLTVEPIGYFHTSASSPYELPRQAGLLPDNSGWIQLKSNCQFEQALEGLEGFDLIWVIFRFHRHTTWKPKVMPPRGGKKQGVFATRSPHRPNFIGFSCVKLEAIEGLTLFIKGHDLLDGTPILDIKPYLNYADSLTAERQGWLEELASPLKVTFQWSPRAQAQLDYLINNWNYALKMAIEHRLAQSPLPYPNHRVKHIQEDEYELAYRTWRVRYTWNEGVVTVLYLKSGYDQETLNGQKNSRWNDVAIHRALMDFSAAY